MPTQLVKKYAEKRGMSIAKAEERWELAKKQAREKFEPDSERFWAYTVGIFKKMMNEEVATGKFPKHIVLPGSYVAELEEENPYAAIYKIRVIFGDDPPFRSGARFNAEGVGVWFIRSQDSEISKVISIHHANDAHGFQQWLKKQIEHFISNGVLKEDSKAASTESRRPRYLIDRELLDKLEADENWVKFPIILTEPDMYFPENKKLGPNPDVYIVREMLRTVFKPAGATDVEENEDWYLAIFRNSGPLVTFYDKRTVEPDLQKLENSGFDVAPLHDPMNEAKTLTFKGFLQVGKAESEKIS